MLAFALEFSDFFIIAAIVAMLAGSSAFASSSQKSHNKLIRQLGWLLGGFSGVQYGVVTTGSLRV